jgi:DNA-damage-inducible protein D
LEVLSEAPLPRMYWADMKRTVQVEGHVELLVKIQQLRMPAADGKLRLTDAADEETLLRLIQSIPSPKAEPFSTTVVLVW